MGIHTTIYQLACSVNNDLEVATDQFNAARKRLVAVMGEQQMAVTAFGAIAQNEGDAEYIAERGAKLHAAALEALNEEGADDANS